MFLKAFGLAAPVAAGAMYMMGLFGGTGYSRVVDRPPAAVMAALEDLDITRQPGSPGTDPAASGGVTPVFQLSRGADRLTWRVMSGDKVATAMTAVIEPVDGGQRSRVTASVERGDAPDDFVSPAFRSTGITLGLFGMAIESELNQLVAPPKADPAKCQALMDRFTEENMASGFADRPGSLGEAMGKTAQITMKLQAMEAELRRQGCDTERPEGFTAVRSEMGAASPPPVEGVNFAPGKPMVDVTAR
jgi:hypothetical protein